MIPIKIKILKIDPNLYTHIITYIISFKEKSKKPFYFFNVSKKSKLIDKKSTLRKYDLNY